MPPKPPRRVPARKSAKKAKMELLSDAPSVPEDEEQKQMVRLDTHNDLYYREIECAEGVSGEIATFDGQTGKYVQTITLVSDKPFSLNAKETQYGKDKGRAYISIEPEPTEEEKFPFLRLPPEIRNMVYSHVLERPGFTIGIEGKWAGKIKLYWRDADGQYFHASEPAVRYNGSLMRVNKQVYDETAAYLFGHHSFEFTDTTMLERFLRQVGPEKAKALVSIRALRQYHVSRKKAFNLLKAATSLQRFELDLADRYGGNGFEADVAAPLYAHLMFPAVQAMIEAGRDRDEALGVFTITNGLRGACDVHGRFSRADNAECDRRKKAYRDLGRDLVVETEKLLDEAERKKTKAVQGRTAKSRAGRNRQVVDYAEDSSGSDHTD